MSRGRWDSRGSEHDPFHVQKDFWCTQVSLEGCVGIVGSPWTSLNPQYCEVVEGGVCYGMDKAT